MCSRKMKQTKELYGTDDVMLVDQDIIDDRLSKLRANKEKLLAVDYMHRDDKLINDIIKAECFWENINNV